MLGAEILLIERVLREFVQLDALPCRGVQITLWTSFHPPETTATDSLS